ncbi:uncharacterized protein NECHADRAFT_48037 [Fusarium vanettenii 77-13-4]|uniref:Transcription factor domain-containing protein n=1 Tax=Fusarium vanettenii (strain ATCC MYA-4622 / CBS 123669 / FGSC 9596 / NRRL 45880 / 77-13-4) TaxID=660122 RepID=C7ZCR3_FUSV7|nr:uncharacterized protein NECHADRAFT_48037 [Fusarium vanettenii 77-13-4]EEU38087.1 hypothetical protein NECHADRAFT_48037 [Fusarium vanettenii 77-13-4]
MDPSKKKRLLFVHSTGPTHVHGRDKTSRAKIRRHVMEDIGKSRRKPRRNPQFMIKMPFWSQDPLSVLEQQWGMDAFSAYGITLLGSEGKRFLGNADALTPEGFSFPFAFTSSAFLRHFKAIFSDQSILKAIHRQSSARIKVVALERALETITCIEAAMASPSFDPAIGDRVFYAILSIICYNLLEMDLDQARVHLEGLSLLIAARGGMKSLTGNNELRLMIFWVDVMTCLLFDTRPRYPLPQDLIPAMSQTDPSNGLPLSLLRIMAAVADTRDSQLTHIPACVTGLNAIATMIESELTTRGDSLWKDEIFLGLRINPLAHLLFDHPIRSTRFSSPLDQTLASIRLGVIVWIICVKRMYRSWPGSRMAYVPELLDSLSTQSSTASNTSDDILSVNLWLSVLCGVASCHGSRERKAVVSLIVYNMQQLNNKEWSESMMDVRKMPWISSFEAPLAEVRRDVQCLRVLQ